MPVTGAGAVCLPGTQPCTSLPGPAAPIPTGTQASLPPGSSGLCSRSQGGPWPHRHLPGGPNTTEEERGPSRRAGGRSSLCHHRAEGLRAGPARRGAGPPRDLRPHVGTSAGPRVPHHENFTSSVPAGTRLSTSPPPAAPTPRLLSLADNGEGRVLPRETGTRQTPFLLLV